MDELISRQEAIDTIRQLYIDLATQKYVIDILKALASVKPQEKTGHWIEDEYEMEVRCSECGEENDECSKYCPNCGAMMVEPQEGSE